MEIVDRLWRKRLEEPAWITTRPSFLTLISSTPPSHNTDWFFDLYMRGAMEFMRAGVDDADEFQWAPGNDKTKPEALICVDEVAYWRPKHEVHVGVDVGQENGDYTAAATFRQCGKTALLTSFVSVAAIPPATKPEPFPVTAVTTSDGPYRYEPEDPKKRVPFYRKFQPKRQLR